MSTLKNQENSDFFVEQSLIAARDGSQDALGSLFEFYRDYLLKIANNKLGRDISIKVAASDLVQETLMLATRDFGQFRGGSDEELKLWLQQILLHRAVDVHRRYKQAEKRDINREVSILGKFNNSQSFIKALEVSLTPSQPILNREKIQILFSALNNISEDFREVIHSRNFEKLSFEEIGHKMGRSDDAVRKLWKRAVEKLGQELRRIDPNFNERL